MRVWKQGAGPRLLLLVFLTSFAARPESIWDSENLIADRRYKVHDLITIIIKEQSQARTSSTAEAKRGSIRDLDLIDFFNVKGAGFKEGPSTRPAIRYRYQSERDKEGEITHKEDFTARITARVIEVLPNGNLVFEARKAVRIGEEESTIVFSGEVRPQDISESNTVVSDYVADARIEYRGRGAVTDAIKRGWITRLFDFANLF
jgi:flagellar L-ring protein precursor FlgH